MILPFSKEINGKQSYFLEKINKAIALKEQIDLEEFYNQFVFFKQINKNSKIFLNCNPKIHTIRKDTKNRWKSGNKIHAVYNNRQKNQFQFTHTFECKGVQTIVIDKSHFAIINEYSFSIEPYFYTVSVDGKLIDYPTIEQLAINDGFDSIESFFEWFNDDFAGKIIHFTDFRY